MAFPFVFVTLPIVLGLYVIRKYREHQWGSYKSSLPLTGKVFLITGSNSGIGKETARALAERNALVIMACRDMDKAKSAIHDIRKSTTSGDLIPMKLDLTSFDSISMFAGEVLQRFPKLHVLINNAGVYYPLSSDEKTKDGYEMNFGVNHMGHFLLTNLLMNRIRDSSPSRIINVTSSYHKKGIIDIDDLNMEKKRREPKKYGAQAAYCASKLANIYHIRELAHRLQGSGVDVFALCPGFAYTNLFRNSGYRWWSYVVMIPIAFFFMRSSGQAAQTVVRCATDNSLEGKSGEYYYNCKPHKLVYNFDPMIQLQLWQKCEELTKNFPMKQRSE